MPNGNAVTNVTIATSESWKDKQTGQQQERTEWHRVVFFNRLAEIAGEYMRKGGKVYVEGALRTRKWQDQSGADRYTTEIVASEMQLLDSRGGNDGGYQQPQQQGGYAQQQQSAPAPQQQQQTGGSLRDILKPEIVGPILRNKEVRDRLLVHLPEEHRETADLEELVQTPQFKSQLERFSEALQSGQMDLGQFGFGSGLGLGQVWIWVELS